MRRRSKLGLARIEGWGVRGLRITGPSGAIGGGGASKRRLEGLTHVVGIPVRAHIIICSISVMVVFSFHHDAP
jgi:hypothetical protein